ncbi:hypothetical protein MNBD_DELTA03-1658, partial [hydrothermal vent metagenome]
EEGETDENGVSLNSYGILLFLCLDKQK